MQCQFQTIRGLNIHRVSCNHNNSLETINHSNNQENYYTNASINEIETTGIVENNLLLAELEDTQRA